MGWEISVPAAILYARQSLVASLGPQQADSRAIGLYILFNIAYAAFSYPVGLLSERTGKRPLLVAGYLLFALMCVGFLVPARPVVALAPLFVLGGVYIAIVDTIEGALAAELLPDRVRATEFGLLGTVSGVGDLISSLVVGLLWAHVSLASGFIYAAILAVLGAGLLARRPRSRR